ncbi:uncharacterized protein METZ01_LOCUS140279 [marine metagenome]|uniref:Uncharacterized protein n=1 Tax=marine metagenome TaxID=408172 RepID=A0A381ZDP5_9ZZZZ
MLDLKLDIASLATGPVKFPNTYLRKSPKNKVAIAEPV